MCRAGWDDLRQSGKSSPALSTHTPLSQKCLGKKKKRVKSLVFQWIECFCCSDLKKNKQNFLTVESFWWLSCECLSIAYYLGWNQVLKSFNMWSHDKILIDWVFLREVFLSLNVANASSYNIILDPQISHTAVQFFNEKWFIWLHSNVQICQLTFLNYVEWKSLTWVLPNCLYTSYGLKNGK